MHKNLLFGCLIVVVFAACSKDEESMLTRGTWRDGNDYSNASYSDTTCYKDDYFEFRKDGILIIEPGPKKCYSSQFRMEMPYRIEDDKLIYGGNTWAIRKLTYNEMVLERLGLMQPTTQRFIK